MEGIVTKINKILNEEFEIALSDIKPEANLYEDLELDSLDAVDMIVCLEEEIGKKIEATEFMEVKTISDVYKVVEKIVNE